ncbi:MAG: DUF2974 domain-containing protein [Gemmiger formicilis]|uniref:Mbeg1-like protein n=1 Tax=Gemmiger formicilis TaxID=745368 RepID=UPI003FEEE165|nr:DUF2974 domain-containing protein [Gemmiger formicilis]
MSETNISGYAASNSEPLTAANYNEVDALLFAELSYTRFEDVYKNGSYTGKTVSVKEFANAAIKEIYNGAKSDDLSQDKDAMHKVELLQELANSERYADCKIMRMQSSEGTDSQWAAMTIDINDGSNTSVVAMRGTDGTTTGWTEDFELLANTEGTKAQKLSQQYLEGCTAEHIMATGHSKGGNDVVSAYVMADADTRAKVIHIDNFDGPGVNDKFSELYKEGYGELVLKLDNYYPQDSIVGLLLRNNPGKSYFICSNAEESAFAYMSILAEHDPFTWHIDGQGFVKDDQGFFSKLLDMTTDGIVATMPQKDRVRLYNILCGLQIPQWISSEDALYEMNEEDTNAWLEEQLRAGKLTQEQVDWYRNSNMSKVEAFFLLYQTLSPDDKMLIAKVCAAAIITTTVMIKIPAMLIWGAAIGVAELLHYDFKKYIDNAMAEVARAYAHLADIVAKKAKEIAKAISDFVDDIRQKVENTWQKVQNFIFSQKRRSGTGAAGTGNFAADTDAMLQIADEMQTEYGVLQSCAQIIQNIANSVCWSTSVAYGWQIGRLADSIRTEARTCSRMGKGLSRTAALYQKTERKITAEAGL